jgi:acyl-CoA thioester hydrolase
METHPRKHLYTFDFPLRWIDMDAYRHISNARYFDAMSETRAQWLRHVLKDNALTQCLYYVAETQCTYIKAFTYPGIMQVKQYIIEVQRSNFTLQYDFYSPNESTSNEQLYARGIARMVCIDAVTEKLMRIPESLLAQIALT